VLHGLLLTGAWDVAEQVCEAGVSEDGLSDDPLFAWNVVLLRAFRGDRAGAAEWLPVLGGLADTEDAQELACAAAAYAAAAAAEASFAEALSYARRGLTFADALGLAAEAVRWVWSMAADAAFALEDYSEVRRLLGWLDDYPPGHIPPVLRAERLRIRARLLAIENNPEAGAAFDAAIKAFRDFGSPYHLAVALLDQADHLADGGDPGRAQELAAEANSIAERLGAQPLTDRAREVIDPRGDRKHHRPSQAGVNAKVTG
jgi:tetratricopeptide (TPR) repeat protein